MTDASSGTLESGGIPESSGGATPEVRLLHVRDLAIPIAVGQEAGEEMSPDLMRLQADFFAGKELSREEMGELMQLARARSRNRNCWGC